ncbi:hypothetical protein RJ640_026966, partial [Escallonia rubra]
VGRFYRYSAMNTTQDQGQMTSEEEELARVMQLSVGFVLPMVWKAAYELELFEIMAKASAQLTSREIASHLPTQNPEAPAMLERVLRFLASNSFLTCTLITDKDGNAKRLYGLAPICKLFFRDHNGASMAPFMLLLLDKVLVDSWFHLKDAIIEGGIPFNKAHGMHAFEYPAKDGRFNEIFNAAMHGQTILAMTKILETYKGFEGVKEVVDVGGGTGAALGRIVSRYPQIKGTNFDLPHVIRDAPPCPGVQHIEGDMFQNVPHGEVIFMKCVLHDWSDGHCLKFLKNCRNALPQSGKVVVVEYILPEYPETDLMSRNAAGCDMYMLTINPGGKERTEKEFEALARGAGFAAPVVVCRTFSGCVMELHKINIICSDMGMLTMNPGGKNKRIEKEFKALASRPGFAASKVICRPPLSLNHLAAAANLLAPASPPHREPPNRRLPLAPNHCAVAEVQLSAKTMHHGCQTYHKHAAGKPTFYTRLPSPAPVFISAMKPTEGQIEMTSEEEDLARFMQLPVGFVLPMVLKAAYELDVLEIMAKASAQLTSREIASHLPTQNPEAPAMLERVLRFLASNSFLTCTLITEEDGNSKRLYGLAPICKLFVRDHNGASMAPFMLLLHDKVFVDSWFHLKDAIIEGGIPFHKAHGMHAFDYPAKDGRFNEIFNAAMHSHSTLAMTKILETYKGFEGVKEVVDVGGGTGATLGLIISKYPQIKGINFDLSHVIRHAPPCPGVQHIEGDMFQDVPHGKVIFMKTVLHDWSDGQCLKLLKNCGKALAQSGKVVVVESILPEYPETDLLSRSVACFDMHMLTNPGGKERTLKEFEALARGAGFATPVVVCRTSAGCVMELYKM